MDGMMDTKEAAAYLKITASTLNHYRVSGRGPAFYKLGPQFVRYKKADLDEWALSCRCKNTSQIVKNVGIKYDAATLKQKRERHLDAIAVIDAALSAHKERG